MTFGDPVLPDLDPPELERYGAPRAIKKRGHENEGPVRTVLRSGGSLGRH
jgi:hypothetical protein